MSSSNNYNYPFFSRILHKLALGSSEILALFFKIEKKLFLQKVKNHQPKSLFITGLARSSYSTNCRARSSRRPYSTRI